MNRKTKKVERLPLAIEIKLKAYKKKGEVADPRVLFSAGIPQFFQTEKDKPYGYIHLYDDMTEPDVALIFRAHKKERKAFLAQFGNSKRKYITSKTDRDHAWVQIAKKYKQKSYTKIAIRWAQMYPDEAVSLFAAHLWSNPAAIESLELKTLKSSKSKKDFLSYVSALKPTDQLIKDNFDEYIHNSLPKVIRPAVLRYTSARK